MKTSVIIAVYERVDFLKNCLLSLIHQSQLPDEIVISDDGSKEDVKGALVDLLPQISCALKYVRQENRGFRLARSRNNGVRVSDGDYLIFLDQDLIFTKNLIKTFIDQQEAGKFTVCYPVRLTQAQTQMINEDVIANFRFEQIFAKKQIEKIHSQFRKDKFYYFLHKFHLRPMGPKFRGGAAGINRKDYGKINGYDENYIGWGNEDDDVGQRLYHIGVQGKNISREDFPIHLYHEPFHNQGERVNLAYHEKKRRAIRRGHFRAEVGLANPVDPDEIQFEQLK